MDLLVNGKKKTFAQEKMLDDLIQELCPNPKCVIAEINEAIVKRDLWNKTSLKDGDNIELVTFVGGG